MKRGLALQCKKLPKVTEKRTRALKREIFQSATFSSPSLSSAQHSPGAATVDPISLQEIRAVKGFTLKATSLFLMAYASIQHPGFLAASTETPRSDTEMSPGYFACSCVVTQ